MPSRLNGRVALFAVAVLAVAVLAVAALAVAALAVVARNGTAWVSGIAADFGPASPGSAPMAVPATIMVSSAATWRFVRFRRTRTPVTLVVSDE